MEAALIHVGQLRHLVGLAGEDEALFLLLIEEGIEAIHLQAVFHPEVTAVPLAHSLHRSLGGHFSGGRAVNSHQGEIDAGLDTNSLVQIEVLISVSVVGDAENGHARAADQPHIFGATVDGGVAAVELESLPQFTAPGPQTTAAFRQNGAKPLETHLIQITDHGTSSHKTKKMEQPYDCSIII